MAEKIRRKKETGSCLNLVFPNLEESLELYDYNLTRGILILSCTLNWNCDAKSRFHWTYSIKDC